MLEAVMDTAIQVSNRHANDVLSNQDGKAADNLFQRTSQKKKQNQHTDNPYT
jgi:hypothetical protein